MPIVRLSVERRYHDVNGREEDDITHVLPDLTELPPWENPRKITGRKGMGERVSGMLLVRLIDSLLDDAPYLV